MSDLLQQRLEVYWKSYERYYKGRITTYKKRTDEHWVEYDDGDGGWVRLREERYRLIDGSGAKYVLEDKSKLADMPKQYIFTHLAE